MNYTFLDKQKMCAKQNYNYFFMRMIFKIFLILFKVSFVLIFRQIFNNNFIDIFCMVYITCSIYNIYCNIKKYNVILKDIQKSLNIDNFYVEIDFRGNLFKKVVYYGK